MGSLIGAGGMGDVYRAVHRRIGMDVAIKVLKMGLRDERFLDRFTNEARIHARLRHPAIAVLHDFVEWNGQLCIIMEYIEGRTLSEHIVAAGTLSLHEATAIFRQVVDAIVYVHRQGIIHRDIKSSNIKITPRGEVKLLDFGIAKDSVTPNLTLTGKFIGTLQYLAPEQLSGKAVDARSDIWALGILFYEMLTGRMPFDALDIGTLMKKISRVDYFAPSVWQSDLPAQADAIVSRCLKKRPSDRYSSAQELLRDIEQLPTFSCREDAHQPAAISPRVYIIFRGRRLAVLVVLAVMVTAGAFFYIAAWHQEPTPSVIDDSQPGPVVWPEVSLSSSPVSEGVNTAPVTIKSLVGADVYVNGRFQGATPITFDSPVGGKIEVLLKKVGYRDKRKEITVRELGNEYFELLDRSEEE